jgi:hypothetical protein
MKKIIVVVADTVTGANGITVVQPLGRRVAQVAHVVSKVRVAMFIAGLWRVVGRPSNIVGDRLSLVARIKKIIEHLALPFEPFTTIVLSCRDSKELLHVQGLMNGTLPYEVFEDYDQPDYGDVNLKVTTAIATWPVESDKIEGITDYLPLLYK